EHVRASRAVGRTRHDDGALRVLGEPGQCGFLVGPVFRDIDLAGDSDLRRVEWGSARPARSAVERDAFADDVGRGILIENEVEPASSSAADGRRTCGRDPDWRMRTLRRRRLDHDVLEFPEEAMMGKSLARGPGALDHLERFFETRLRLLRRDT